MARRSKYPLPPRANVKKGFWGCAFCKGSGCLACEGESKRLYKEQFPDGPKPILTIKAEYREDLAAMQDEGCPNVDSPTVFPAPTGDSAIEQLTRKVLAMLPTSLPSKENS